MGLLIWKENQEKTILGIKVETKLGLTWKDDARKQRFLTRTFRQNKQNKVGFAIHYALTAMGYTYVDCHPISGNESIDVKFRGYAGKVIVSNWNLTEDKISCKLVGKLKYGLWITIFEFSPVANLPDETKIDKTILELKTKIDLEKNNVEI